MSSALPPRAVRILRRLGRASIGFIAKGADAAVGPGGIMGTGFGPRAGAAPLLLIGTFAGSETCADALEVIATQWASEGGNKVGELVRDRMERKAEAEKAGAPKTVDQVIASGEPKHVEPERERVNGAPRARGAA